MSTTNNKLTGTKSKMEKPLNKINSIGKIKKTSIRKIIKRTSSNHQIINLKILKYKTKRV